jgi:glycine/D-amino acid oxidase-like deaminating enzyme
VRLAGAELVVRRLMSLADVTALPEPVVVNCTGLGSAELFGDVTLTPIKGQLTVLLPQPEVDYAVLAGDLYMFSRPDGILLGGTHERGVATLEPDLVAKERILDGHARLFGAMAGG